LGDWVGGCGCVWMGWRLLAWALFERTDASVVVRCVTPPPILWAWLCFSNRRRAHTHAQTDTRTPRQFAPAVRTHTDTRTHAPASCTHVSHPHVHSARTHTRLQTQTHTYPLRHTHAGAQRDPHHGTPRRRLLVQHQHDEHDSCGAPHVVWTPPAGRHCGQHLRHAGNARGSLRHAGTQSLSQSVNQSFSHSLSQSLCRSVFLSFLLSVCVAYRSCWSAATIPSTSTSWGSRESSKSLK
jgi:hypothetical protein